MERYSFHIIISIQASDTSIIKTRTGGRAVDRSIGTSTGRPQWRLGGLGFSGHSCVSFYLPRLFKFIPTTHTFFIGQTCGYDFLLKQFSKKMSGELSIGCQK